jgi:hypothetical protein
MSDAAASVMFLPWVRQGAATAITAVDTLGSQPGSTRITATVSVNSADPVPMPVRLFGPSDVAGLNPRAIVRREPPPATLAFEDNHLASIEVDRPDFPWLFTPAKADANGRLRPWLCLVVVRQQKGVELRPGSDTSLSRLEIVAPAVAHDELPDLADSWLWAHGQVTGSENTDTNALTSTLAGSSNLSLSRLLCPRVLQPDTDYLACLVPTFEAGRLAGLGMPVDSDVALQPAWAADAASVTLPAYDHWSFRTGSGGDFKALVQKLRAQPAPAGLGTRPIDISHPGFALPAAFPVDVRLDLAGALQPLNAETTTWPEGTAEAFQSALADIVNTTTAAADADPLLAPPLYGRTHAARDQATLAGTSWFDELNLDPRHRSVAAFGTRVVQEHQEALMASAWQQAGDLPTANQRLRQLQLSLFESTSLHQRHFVRMDADALVRVAAPAFTRIRAAARPGDTQAKTLLSVFDGVKVPLRSVMPAMRKLSRNRGPVNRRLTRVNTGSVGMNAFLVGLNAATFTVVNTTAASGMATFTTLRQASNLSSMQRYADVTAEAVTAMPGAPQFQLEPEGVRIPMPVEGVETAATDNPVASAFRVAAAAHLTKLNPARPWVSVFAPQAALELQDVQAHLRTELRPMERMVARANAVIVRAEPAPASVNADVPVAPLGHDPYFPQPMYEALRDLSQELLLPGLDTVPANAVIGLRTNERFVNAYMVGLNAEMGRELLWRGYPTDQRGTYFDRFWDAAGATAQADIDPLDEWNSRPLQGPPTRAEGTFVMLLRSELLQRYPTASIYAVPAVRAANGQRVLSEDPTVEEHPVLRGSLPPDVTFVGFRLTEKQITAGEGYFIVIQEHPTEPRFGLDSGVAPAGRYLATDSGAPTGVPLRNLQWRQNSAHMAGILRRLPVRIAIHASQFITPGQG